MAKVGAAAGVGPAEAAADGVPVAAGDGAQAGVAAAAGKLQGHGRGRRAGDFQNNFKMSEIVEGLRFPTERQSHVEARV